MDPHPFRPTLDGLETRLVPTANPTEVVAAYTRIVSSTDELFELGTTLQRGRTTQSISFLATHLPQVALQNRTDYTTILNYRGELAADIAADPAVATAAGPALQEFLQQLAGAQVQAVFNSVYGDIYARGFGGTPIPPPPPPPPPPGDGSPVFGPDTSGTTPTTPTTPASTLPFSLTDPNFRTLSNGVKVWDVTAGTGTTVSTGSQFTATYTGYLTNGTVFDSGTLPSTTLDTAHLIPGFVSGLDGIQVGGTRRIFIPSALGYGSTAQAKIPANSDLVFEVHVTSSP